MRLIFLCPQEDQRHTHLSMLRGLQEGHKLKWLCWIQVFKLPFYFVLRRRGYTDSPDWIGQSSGWGRETNVTLAQFNVLFYLLLHINCRNLYLLLHINFRNWCKYGCTSHLINAKGNSRRTICRELIILLGSHNPDNTLEWKVSVTNDFSKWSLW